MIGPAASSLWIGSDPCSFEPTWLVNQAQTIAEALEQPGTQIRPLRLRGSRKVGRKAGLSAIG